jgi:hypothetical protein
MARTKIDIRPDPIYFEALGRFVHEFATLEAVVFNTLAFYAKVPNNMARALFSGTRVRAAMGLIKRITQIQDPGEENKTDLEYVFRQIEAINTLRDDILHQGSVLTDDKGRITSNIVRNLTPNRLVERSASTETLNAATADLSKISLHLVCQQTHPQASLVQRAAIEGCAVLKDPWQYKLDQ